MGPRRFGILAVCTANICRSPLMEVLFRTELDAAEFEVASAGVQGWDSAPMDGMVVMELARLGQTPAPFSSQPINSYLVESADLILTATRAHRADVLGLNPQALRRTFTLLEFAALVGQVHGVGPRELVAEAARQRSLAPADVDIGDPYRRAPEVHRATADQIAAAVHTVSTRLNALVAVG